MINTVADLLNEIKAAEMEILKKQKLPNQTVLIGNTYESTTKKILDKSIFQGLGLSIIKNSFIQEGDLFSKELDIALIEGAPIPFYNLDDQFKISIDQLIAVIQVKKTLNPTQLLEGYQNLKSIYDVAEVRYQQYQNEMFHDAYKSICNEPAAVNGKIRKEFKNGTSEQIYQAIKFEAYLPVRILFSYQGYKTEKGLRNAFYDYIKENISSREKEVGGFNPLHFPNLVVSGDAMLIKNNALPYTSKLDDQDWHFYSSTTGNPFLPLLEMIWTRLSYKYHLSPQIFGEDLSVDQLNPFLSGNIVYADGLKGWHFEPYKIKKEPINTSTTDWMPTQVDEIQFKILTYLCQNGYLRLNRLHLCFDSDLHDSNQIIEDLLKTDLVYISGHKELRLLTEACRTFDDQKGKLFVADDKTGRFSRWVKKNYPNFRRQ